jgi:hypothetical protein
MINKTPKHRSSYFFTEQIRGTDTYALLDPAMSHSNQIRSKDMFEYILRWEDDGGMIVEVNSSGPDQIFVQPVRRADHDQAVPRRHPEMEKPNASKSWFVD